jgi:hypothetical protein
MGKIILISLFMFFFGCTGFKSLPNQDEIRLSKKAIKYVKAAVYFCGEMIEEAQREKPNYKLIENKFINFQKKIRNAQRQDLEILNYYKIYKGKTYKQWVNHCEKEHFVLSDKTRIDNR